MVSTIMPGQILNTFFMEELLAAGSPQNFKCRLPHHLLLADGANVVRFIATLPSSENLNRKYIWTKYWVST